MKKKLFVVWAFAALASLVSCQSQQSSVTTPQESMAPLHSENLGINLPWLNNHDGSESVNWLNTDYDAAKIDADLAGIQSLGIKKIRAFLMLESVMDYDETKFVWNPQARANLHDFLRKCEARGISVIVVMNSGNNDGSYASLDGKFRWDLIKTQGGINKYIAAQTLYINEYKAYNNILMFELCNEPYGELTWSPAAIASGVTKDEVHIFLKRAYDNAKTLTDIYVGFSELEEEEQSKYRVFSDPTNRTEYIDDCTDVYSMHFYRPDASYIADFRNLTNKPKWATEVGNLNYYDPDALVWPMAGHNELYDTELNFLAVVDITRKLIDSGFSCVYPWSWSSNIGMVVHNPDGTHTILKLPMWMKSQLTGQSAAEIN